MIACLAGLPPDEVLLLGIALGGLGVLFALRYLAPEAELARRIAAALDDEDEDYDDDDEDEGRGP